VELELLEEEESTELLELLDEDTFSSLSLLVELLE
jgi:hypothetical protein